jgi:hypothetical protein
VRQLLGTIGDQFIELINHFAGAAMLVDETGEAVAAITSAFLDPY